MFKDTFGRSNHEWHATIHSLSLCLSNEKETEKKEKKGGNVRNTVRINGILEQTQIQFYCTIYIFV
jgi:hypothetical protein